MDADQNVIFKLSIENYYELLLWFIYISGFAAVITWLYLSQSLSNLFYKCNETGFMVVNKKISLFGLQLPFGKSKFFEIISSVNLKTLTLFRRSLKAIFYLCHFFMFFYY